MYTLLWLIIAAALLLVLSLLRRPSPKKPVVRYGTICKHPITDTCINLFGKSYTLDFPKDAAVEYCAECIKEASVQCPWCLEAILPGNEIIMYLAENRKIPQGLEKGFASVSLKKPLVVAGCCREECRKHAATPGKGTWRIGPNGQGYPLLEEKKKR